MNKIKEKKLNSIKSQLVEITDFVKTSLDNKTEKVIFNEGINFEKKDKNTITLTKIVNYGPNNLKQIDDISFIKKELNHIRDMLAKQEKILEKIVQKFK